MARWAGLAVLLVMLVAVMAGKVQCRSGGAGEGRDLLEPMNVLIKSVVDSEGFMKPEGRVGDSAAVLQLVADRPTTFVTGFNVTIGFGRIDGRTGDGKTFSGTGSRGLGVAAGVLIQLPNITHTTSYEVRPVTTGNLTLHAIGFSTSEGDLVGAWLGRFALPALVPASAGAGTFSTTNTSV